MTPLPQPMVEVREVSKTFGAVKAVDRASIVLGRGEFLTILGPSGCGKSTLLRLIAGFLRPSGGSISIRGESVADVPPHRRSIGMVFQRLALFPHMTAAQNIAYPLRMRRHPPSRISDLVARYLAIVKLEDLGERRIDQLSGGQQQRVAIARALVFSPDLLLLDEPLSALDRKLREEMQLELRRIQRELGVTTINVTHDQREALVMSDRIVVMKDGVIQQAEDPISLYRRPSNRFVAGFIGLTAFLDGTLEADGGILVGRERLRGRLGQPPPAPGARVACALRAEQVRIFAADAPPEGLESAVEGQVRERIFEGDRVVYEVDCASLGGALLYAFDHDPLHHKVHEPGQPVRLGWNAADLMIFPGTGSD